MKPLAACVFVLTVVAPAFAAETTLLSVPPSVPLSGGRGQLLGGDFDGDGIRDFLVMSDEGVLAMHHGLGDGTFAPAVLTHAHHSRYNAAAAAADFDRDGFLDVAIHQYSVFYSDVLLFYGRAGGTFVRGATLPAPRDTSPPELGDFTGDGILDLVLPGSVHGVESISVYPGDGNGFGVPIVTPTALGWSHVYSAGVGDFDGDRNLDLAIGSPTHTYVSYGTGHGRFGRSATLTGGARSLAVADFNSDGRPDWSAVEFGYTRSVVRAFINQPDGTFAVRELGILPESSRILAADMNGDGVADVVSHSAGSHLAIFTSRNDGTFTPARLFTPGKELWSFDAGRFDGDALPDVLAAGPAVASVVRGRGDGTLDAPESYATGAVPRGSRVDPLVAVHLSDVTGDGLPDAIAVGGDAERRAVINVLANDGHGRFGAPVETSTPIIEKTSLAVANVAADFTGDGRIDLAIVTHATGLHLFAGRGDGTFDAPVVTSGVRAEFVKAADFNGDRRPDLISVSWPEVIVYLNAGGGRFGPGIVTRGQFGSHVSYAIADFNRDGHLDVAFTPELVFLGYGNGRFFADASDSSWYYGIVAAGDFDEDGFTDLIVQRFFSIHFFRGDGDGTFSDRSEIRFDRDLSWRTDPVTADVDGDGHLDLVSAATPTPDTGHVTILLGDGQGSFAGLGSLRYGGSAGALAVADLDGNGSLDVVVVDAWSSTIDVFRTHVAPPLGVPATVTFTGPASATHGQPFTNTVEVNSTSRYVYDGAVILREGGRTVEIQHADPAGKATFRFLYPAGTADVTAALAEDRVFTAAPADRHFDVDKGRIVLALELDDRAYVGEPVKFGYEYTIEGGTELSLPTGPLTFTVEGLHQQTFHLPFRGSFSAVLNRVGAFTVTIDYRGDANYHPVHFTTGLVITQPLGGVALLIEPKRRVFSAGEAVTFAAVVTPATGGTVSFFNRDFFLGSATVRNGVARLTTTTLPSGKHLVHAVFSGHGTIGPSRSTGVYVTVEGPPAPPKRRSAGR
jgi:Bacterial Ig-like domain (group 3)/FG-GAP-like repeat